MALKLVGTSAPFARPPMATDSWSSTNELGPGRAWIRRRDRRTQFSCFLAQLAADLEAPRPTDWRTRLEQALRRLTPAASLAIRELPGEVTSDIPPADANRLTVTIPGRQNKRVRIEIQTESGRRLDEWTRHVLEDAARVAALVLAVDAAHARSATGSASVTTARGPALLVGSSEAMCRLRQQIVKLACTDFTILIEGESGSGKELVARQLHELSQRRRGPFVAVNCAALVETLFEAELFGIEERTATGVRGRRGKFELAEGGTLFLDEVGDLSPLGQAKLLRAIQELAVERVGGHATRAIDTRVIAATNRNLQDLVRQGRCRPDLYYRLSGVELYAPALRHRREDIPELVRYFLSRHTSTSGNPTLTAGAVDALMSHDWPGNVRELERVIERAVALAGSIEIDVRDLPARLTGHYTDILLPSVTRDDTLRAWAGRYVRLVLERSQRNKRQACRILGISYHTLQAYLRGQDRRPGPSASAGRSSASAGRAEPVEARKHGAGTASRSLEPATQEPHLADWGSGIPHRAPCTVRKTE